jgi:predicted membrane channel-forming protein YqfA (hemolysin III family)
MKTLFTLSLACALASLLAIIGFSAMTVVPRGDAEGFRSLMLFLAGGFCVGWLGLAFWTRTQQRATSRTPPPQWLIRLLVFVGVVYLLGIVALVAGCASQTPSHAIAPDALTAKAALLEAMHKADNSFEGADPAKFETVPLTKLSDNEYTWGAFRIHTSQRTFHADIASAAFMLSIRGDFAVEPDGRWKAVNIQKSHLSALPQR